MIGLSRTRHCFIALLLNACVGICAAQTKNAEITGIITDPSGAVIPLAGVLLIDIDGQTHKTATDKRGVYIVHGLAPGLYTIKITCKDFDSFQQDNVRLLAGQIVRLNTVLNIEPRREEVNVSDQSSGVGISSDSNADASIFQGNDLDALADDPTQLQQQLLAIAGPGAGSEMPQVSVDGFDAGNLPPKSAIREIRINQNPYSAQYDRPGRGRIEIVTKPGADAFHGGLWASGNDSSFNSQNPFISQQPQYHSAQIDFNLGGPITKNSAFFLNFDRSKTQTNAIVDTEILDSNLNQIHFAEAIPNPNANAGFSSRVDFQLGTNNSVTVRYQLSHWTTINGGVGQSALPSQEYDSDDLSQALQISDVQTYGSRAVNQFRFQFSRSQNHQNVQNNAPTITVQGAFAGGGSNAGNLRDDQDHFELQDHVSIDSGKHILKLGGRLRIAHDFSFSNANFNGNFVFSSLDAYQLTVQGIQQGLTPTQIRSEGGGASQFSINSGAAGISLTATDVGLYAEDNWKLRPNLMLNYGLRFETQTNIARHLAFAPRVGLAWGIDGSRKEAAKTIIRAGYGWFYTRFATGYVLQADRQNGKNQTQFLTNSPDFFPNIPPLQTLEAQSASTTYRVSPTIRAPYLMQAGIGVDHQIVKSATVSINYVNSRGVDQLITQNINAPLPGTYNPTDPTSGVRPLGTNQNIYEYESEGVFRQSQLIANINVRHGSRLSVFGSYVLNSAHGNTSAAGSFPSNQYDLDADYGRTLYDIHHRAVLGGSLALPHGFRLAPFVVATTGAPFNIMVGQDLNGDSIFNDRPSFATNLTRPSVVATKWGIFDTVPIAGQRIIPVNYGTGPSQFTADVTVGKTFNFGAGHNHQSLSKKGGQEVSVERYSLAFDVSARNVLNRVNLAQPVGVLGSPLFGTSTALAGSSAANRIVTVQMQFTF
jgi:hypothetical protein